MQVQAVCVVAGDALQERVAVLGGAVAGFHLLPCSAACLSALSAPQGTI